MDSAILQNIKKMDELDLSGKRLLIRSDLNVPLNNGKITSDARILASIPTYKKAIAAGASVMIMSHLGRPEEGKYDESFSLRPVADKLNKLLDIPVRLIKNWINTEFTQQPGELLLLENVRFNTGEKKNNEALSRKIAKLCDIYVMDAFGTAHRAQASTHGVGLFAPVACAGPLLMAELTALETAFLSPKRPMLSIIGGSKVSTKLSVLDSLSTLCDQIIPGGGIANTFLAATGKPVGCSLMEKELIPQAKALMDKIHIPLPVDVVVAKEFSPLAVATTKPIEEVNSCDMIMDIGPQTLINFAELIFNAKTILWNGPVGVFEFNQFSEGTRGLANVIAETSAFSIAGGGDTLAAIEKYKVKEQISYISTGGGAFLEFVEGKTLPAVAMLAKQS